MNANVYKGTNVHVYAGTGGNAVAGAVVIAGANSGAGKTTITCGLLYGLKLNQKRAVAFKCGPDYIDPMFHREVLQTASYNLDSFFLPPQELRDHFTAHGEECDIRIVEGVMGYYDGAGYTTKGSTYEIAKTVGAPVILVVNAKGMANSLLAMLQGFQKYRESSGICGVILNQVSAKTYEALKEEISQLGLVPCGYLPRLNKDLIVENRHLGLVQANELSDFQDRLARLWEVMKDTVDVESILDIAKKCPWADSENQERLSDSKAKDRGGIQGIFPEPKSKVRIAVAKDEAFSFIYQENLEFLEKEGCELAYFSPLHSTSMPENVSGVILSGGYPELYACELSENEVMKEQLRQAIRGGMPVIAECGGYMYLKDSIQSAEGKEYPMLGILPGKCEKTPHLVRFGYAILTACRDNLLGVKGSTLKTHEFHYWDSEENGDGYMAENTKGNQYPCIYASDTMYAGFPHLYYPANVEAMQRFVEKCRVWKKD